VFQRSKHDLCLQVIFRSAFWIRSWSILSKEEDKSSSLIGIRRLETTVLEIFKKYGWNALNRIAYYRLFVFGVYATRVLSAFFYLSVCCCGW
jgi:hypothetical protein